MSKNYYYFVASLPLLFFDSKSSMSLEKFLEDCRRFLSEKDFLLLAALFDEEENFFSAHNKFSCDWLEFNRICCNEMVCFRAERDKKDPVAYLRGERKIEPVIISLIQQAAKLDNLLEAEKIFDEAKWKYLDEVTLGHYFDLEYVLAYGLKLRILNRYQEIYSDKGKEIFEEYKKLGSYS